MNKLTENIRTKIYTIRGIKVMLDRDLADLYKVATGNLNLAVRRNSDRFTPDFVFQLTELEVKDLRLQNVSANISSKSRSLPYVFTEYGTLMLASVLKSDTAIRVNQMIIRAFVEIRQLITNQPEYEQLKDRVSRIESRVEEVAMSNRIDAVVLEQKITAMSVDIRQISETLDTFQEGYIVIKRPEDGIDRG